MYVQPPTYVEARRERSPSVSSHLKERAIELPPSHSPPGCKPQFTLAKGLCMHSQGSRPLATLKGAMQINLSNLSSLSSRPEVLSGLFILLLRLLKQACSLLGVLISKIHA